MTTNSAPLPCKPWLSEVFLAMSYICSNQGLLYHQPNVSRTVSYDCNTNNSNIFRNALVLEVWDSQKNPLLSLSSQFLHITVANKLPIEQDIKGAPNDITYSLFYTPWSFGLPFRRMSKCKITPKTCHISTNRFTFH